MKIGYVRVSTVEQNTIRQEVLLHELGVDEVFIDKTVDGLQKFAVTITETLQKVVTVTAGDPRDAEDAVRREWDNEEHVLGAEHFKGVEFAVVPVCGECG